MKKLFALIMVIAMLSVAGAAMAATTAVTTSTSSVIVRAGNSSTVIVAATAGHGGTMSDITVSGPSWATLSGTTLTLNPSSSVTAGNYKVLLSATETYTDGTDTVSHGTPAPRTETASAIVTVSVVAAGTTGTTVVTRVVEVVTTVTKTVTVIAPVAQRAAVVQTFTEVVRTVTQAVSVAVLTQVDGFTTALAEVWEAKATQVETARITTVTAIASNPARAAQVFRLAAPLTTEQLTPRSNTSLVAATSTVTSTMTVTQKLAAATAALNGAGKALSATDAVQATETGTYSFVKTFGKALYGTRIAGSKGERASLSSSFAASAADEGVAFLNSSGDVVDTIPGDENSQDIMPGYVAMVVVMEAGKTYEPVVYATEADLAANNVEVETTETTVEVNEVTEKEETVVVEISDSGSVEAEKVVEEADTTVATNIASAMGVSEVTLVPATSYVGAVSSATLTAENTRAANADLHIAARPGWVIDTLPAGTYYMAASFDALPTGRTLESTADFVFYPDGISGATEAEVTVFDASGSVVVNPANILGGSGFFAFVIESTGIKTADTDADLENPTITLKMAAADSGDTPGGDTPGGDTPSTEPTGVGGSSGGCSSAGSLLALALLGTFIAARKK